MELVLIRHAESIGNAKYIMQGQWEYPLSEKGHQQAEILARYLQQFLGNKKPTGLYVSPLSRTLETAQKIEQVLNLSFEQNDLLKEASCGIFSGLTWEEAGEKHPEIRAHFKQIRDWGAIPDGESRAEIWQRAHQFLALLKERHQRGEKILIVTHGGFIRAMLGILAGISPDHNLYMAIDNASLSVAGVVGTRTYICYVNRTMHLKGAESPEEIPL